MIIKALLDILIAQFQLPIDSIHGLSHWKRVEEIGRHLSVSTQADVKVISYFAYLHDAKRQNEDDDPFHGSRAKVAVGEMAKKGLIQLSTRKLHQLQYACEIHSQTRTKIKDITIATCLDADRIDLFRLGITPKTELLCTHAGKQLARTEDFYKVYTKLTHHLFRN